MELVNLAHDELDALQLCDAEGMTQEEAGIRMGVSRGTVQRLLSAARSKVAEALAGQKALAIAVPPTDGMPGGAAPVTAGE